MKNLVLTDEQYAALLPHVKAALDGGALPLQTTNLAVIVLCENDFPVGVYTTAERCQLAGEAAIAKRERHRQSQEPKSIFHCSSFILNAEAAI
jgi:hypothetical protein